MMCMRSDLDCFTDEDETIEALRKLIDDLEFQLEDSYEPAEEVCKIFLAKAEALGYTFDISKYGFPSKLRPIKR